MANLIEGPAPRKREQHLEVLRVKTVEAQNFTVLSVQLKAVETHWWKGRSSPCYGSKVACQGCAEEWVYKWKGYLHCIHWQSSSEVFLELTEQAVMLMMKQVSDRSQLRGTNLSILKTKGAARGRYLIEVLERVAPEESMSESRDPVETL